MIKTPTFKLFVYGTLMRGHFRADTLKNERFLSEARTTPHYALLNFDAYPGLIRVENDGRAIQGELFEVNSKLVPVLDRIEGSPDLFRLERIDVEGVDEPVYAYFFKVKVAKPRFCENNRWEGI